MSHDQATLDFELNIKTSKFLWNSFAHGFKTKSGKENYFFLK